MAKTKEAGNTFEPGREYHSRIIAAQWSSVPTVGAGDLGLAVQVKLSVLCLLHDKETPEVVGREAVVFVPVAAKGATYRPSTEIGERFAREIGLRIVVHGPGGQLGHGGPPIICKFGPVDPVYKFQSIEWWRLATPEESSRFLSRAMKHSGRRPPAFGLAFPGPYVATRDGHTIAFGRAKVSYFILKQLAARYPACYPTNDLGSAAWSDCDREMPSGLEQSIWTAVSKLRGLIRPCGLTVERDGGEGYRLAEIKAD
jgi:hypothetical protein